MSKRRNKENAIRDASRTAGMASHRLEYNAMCRWVTQVGNALGVRFFVCFVFVPRFSRSLNFRDIIDELNPYSFRERILPSNCIRCLSFAVSCYLRNMHTTWNTVCVNIFSSWHNVDCEDCFLSAKMLLLLSRGHKYILPCYWAEAFPVSSYISYSDKVIGYVGSRFCDCPPGV